MINYLPPREEYVSKLVTQHVMWLCYNVAVLLSRQVTYWWSAPHGLILHLSVNMGKASWYQFSEFLSLGSMLWTAVQTIQQQNNWKESKSGVHYPLFGFSIWRVGRDFPFPMADVMAYKESASVHLMNAMIHRQLIRVSLSHVAGVSLSHCVPWHRAGTKTRKVTWEKGKE